MSGNTKSTGGEKTTYTQTLKYKITTQIFFCCKGTAFFYMQYATYEPMCDYCFTTTPSLKNMAPEYFIRSSSAILFLA